MVNIKTTIRSLLKDKLFTILNISGFCLGLSCVMVIICLVKEDLSYDRFHKYGGHIFRLVAEIADTENPPLRHANTSFPIGPSLKENFSAIEQSVRFRQAYKGVVSVDRQSAYQAPGFYFVD